LRASARVVRLLNSDSVMVPMSGSGVVMNRAMRKPQLNVDDATRKTLVVRM